MNIFDVKQENIKYDNFDIDFSVPLSEQEDKLLEDLLQIEFPHNYLIDIGWYPEYESRGNFILTLIKDYNWEKPIYKCLCVSKEDLKKSYKTATDMMNLTT